MADRDRDDLIAVNCGRCGKSLNVRIPEWTQKLVEQIFASHLEDWPALLKSLRSVGDDVRARSRAAVAAEKAAVVSEAPNR